MLKEIKSKLTKRNILIVILIILIGIFIYINTKEKFENRGRKFTIKNHEREGDTTRQESRPILRQDNKLEFKDNKIRTEERIVSEEKRKKNQLINNIKTNYLYDIINNLSNECPVPPAKDTLNELLIELKNTENNSINRNLKNPINDIINARTNTCNNHSNMTTIINNINRTQQITQEDITKIKNILKDENKYNTEEINRIKELLNRIGKLN